MDGLDLRIAAGETVALLGSNGAGKSSTVNAALGLFRPDAGSVRLLGRDPAAAIATGGVGAMLQHGGLPTGSRVGEVLALVRRRYAAPWPAEDLTATAGIDGLLGRRVDALSGGQRQRVLLALALAEVRDAVSGYRHVSCAQAPAEARAALSGAGIAVSVPDRLPVLPGGVDATLGWVVREATTNVLRHSDARSVTVQLAEDGVRAVLTETDDGAGPGQRGTVLGDSPGSGLAGLRERVAALGGELGAGPAAGGGFRLRVQVPLVASSAPVARS